MKDGFVKVASAVPFIKVADTEYNAKCIISCMDEAKAKGVKILVFPELTITGYSCYDLVKHKVIIDAAKKALLKIIDASRGSDALIFVGLPVAAGSRLYSCAAVINDGELLGLVPRENVAGSYFTAPPAEPVEVSVGDNTVILAANLLFESNVLPGLTVAAEIGRDSELVFTPAARHAVSGATVIAELASFPETVTSLADNELRYKYCSSALTCGYVMASPGKGESSTDNVWSGLCMIAEDGDILAAGEGDGLVAVSELDVDRLITARRNRQCFEQDCFEHLVFNWGEDFCETELTRTFLKLPHLPAKREDLPAYCRRMIDIQVSGLVKRMEYAHLDHCVVGISGGVDSTLCVMICAMAVKKMGLPPENVVACTLPCFGTSSRTKSNAIIVAEQCGAEVRVIDIGKSVYQHFDDIGHAHDDYSVAYENAQARERTQVLMDIANKVNGLDVGTEDLSEFIDGWCTYNGDHTSMYDVNMGLTKTQVRTNVRYIAETTEDKVLAAALWDVLDCPVTPELLPIHDDMIEQKSEDAVGSYSLQDFFTHCMLIRGFTPSKTFRLAKQAWCNEFTDEELKRWLTSYCKRLFTQQFKRSCLMDGPAVEAFSVSPRNGFLIPSDAESAAFLASLEEI